MPGGNRLRWSTGEKQIGEVLVPTATPGACAAGGVQARTAGFMLHHGAGAATGTRAKLSFSALYRTSQIQGLFPLGLKFPTLSLSLEKL